jgi:ubiquinol-cytochrome c reductase iron-sulfur subunit
VRRVREGIKIGQAAGPARGKVRLHRPYNEEGKMSDSAAASAHGHPGAVTKRDFLKLVTGSAAAIGAGAIAWSFLDYMNPSADVLALSAVDVDLAPISAGSGITVLWQGKPIFVRHRTPPEIKEAEDVKLSELIEPQADAARVKPGHAEWIVVVGICTHLGCSPIDKFSPGAQPSLPSDWEGGFLCPCHGSTYDLAGRVFKDKPAPDNLEVPPYTYLSDTRILIGEDKKA